MLREHRAGLRHSSSPFSRIRLSVRGGKLDANPPCPFSESAGGLSSRVQKYGCSHSSPIFLRHRDIAQLVLTWSPRYLSKICEWPHASYIRNQSGTPTD